MAHKKHGLLIGLGALGALVVVGALGVFGRGDVSQTRLGTLNEAQAAIIAMRRSKAQQVTPDMFIQKPGEHEAPYVCEDCNGLPYLTRAEMLPIVDKLPQADAERLFRTHTASGAAGPFPGV